MKLVDAQQARRVLDRLVGYRLSPFLWSKVRRGLSAGRVQSVAVRLVAEREREIQGFTRQEYWTIDAEMRKARREAGLPSPTSGLRRQEAEARDPERDRIATARRHPPLGLLPCAQRPDQDTGAQTGCPVHNEHSATGSVSQAWVYHQADHADRAAAVRGHIARARGRDWPHYVYADRLHERCVLGATGSAELHHGTISAKSFCRQRRGMYTKKVKGAQEAHEAVRPTSVRREPEAVRRFLNNDQYRLYNLVWQRMVASQMADALFDVTTVDIEAAQGSGRDSLLLRATNTQLQFAGFRQVYEEGRDDDAEEDLGKNPLPALAEQDALRALDFSPEQHFTEPPPRYTEATLIKALEEKGIGRPEHLRAHYVHDPGPGIRRERGTPA